MELNGFEIQRETFFKHVQAAKNLRTEVFRDIPNVSCCFVCFFFYLFDANIIL